MLPYYMNPETRDALIAESKRLIAQRAANAALVRNGQRAAHATWTPALMPAPDADADDVVENSAFAALVTDLWSASSTRREWQGKRDAVG